MQISFIVPVYNAEKYLKRCIESVLKIKSEDIELILVNDGSGDKSFEICCQYEKIDLRVRVISQENKGVSVARNIGIKSARGKYCFFLDADDYIISENVAELLKAARSDIDIVCMNHICEYVSGYHKEECYQINNDENDSMMIMEKQLLTTHMLHTCWGKLFKRKIILENQVEFPVDVRVGEDYLFVLAYCKHISTVKLINVPIIYYCINSTSVMRNYDKDSRLRTWHDLNEYTDKYYRNCGFKFDQEFYLYQFRTFTSMTLRVFMSCNSIDIKDYLLNIMDDRLLGSIVEKIDSKQTGMIKRLELFLVRNKLWRIFKTYFCLKAIVQKYRKDV